MARPPQPPSITEYPADASCVQVRAVAALHQSTHFPLSIALSSPSNTNSFIVDAHSRLPGASSSPTASAASFCSGGWRPLCVRPHRPSWRCTPVADSRQRAVTQPLAGNAISSDHAVLPARHRMAAGWVRHRGGEDVGPAEVRGHPALVLLCQTCFFLYVGTTDTQGERV